MNVNAKVIPFESVNKERVSDRGGQQPAAPPPSQNMDFVPEGTRERGGYQGAAPLRRILNSPDRVLRPEAKRP